MHYFLLFITPNNNCFQTFIKLQYTIWIIVKTQIILDYCYFTHLLDFSFQGYVQHDNNAYQQGQAGGQSVSVFTVANQKLLGFGLPRFNVGPYVVEPIVLVAFVLAGVLMGLPGLIFAALLFFVSQWSGIGGGEGGGEAGQRMGGGNQGGGGHRLG